MTRPIRPVPSTPNLARDKKEAKTLRAAVAERDREALQRARRAHPAFAAVNVEIDPARFTLRDAQLVLAREYGFDDWSEWKDFVAATTAADTKRARFLLARRAIDKKDPRALRRALDDDPWLTTHRDDEHGLLIESTQSYANFAGADEAFWVSVPCAELLVDRGSPVPLHVINRAIQTASSAMVGMFLAKGSLAPCLRAAACVGDLDLTRSFFDADGALAPAGRPPRELLEPRAPDDTSWPEPDANPRDVLADAFRYAIHHGHRPVARELIDRCIDEDPRLVDRIDADLDTFVDELLEERNVDVDGPFDLFWVQHTRRMNRAIDANDVAAFESSLAERPELLDEAHVDFQASVIEGCAYGFKNELAKALLDAGAAVRRAPPPSKATVYAIDYGNRAMIELIGDIWPPSDDLPTCAGLGDLDRVRGYFDEHGRVRSHHALAYPREGVTDDPRELLMHAFGLAVMNDRFDVAEFLLARGADVDGPWGLHEPATVLHETAGNGRMGATRFLVEHGADVTIRDSRYDGEPFHWAKFGGHDALCDYLRPFGAAKKLTSAVQYGDVDDVRRHLDAGVDVDESIALARADDVTPLMLAVTADRPDIVTLLLEHGADVQRVDTRRRGVLHRIQPWANHGARLVEILVTAGADVSLVSNDGETPWMSARASGQDDAAAALVRHGAKESDA